MCAMQQKRIFLIGPPVNTSSQVSDLVLMILSRGQSDNLKDFAAKNVAPPVPFRSEWRSDSKLRQRPERPGMETLMIWCIDCSWTGNHYPYESFALIVQDGNFYAEPSRRRHGKSPTFETFVVTCPLHGKVLPGNVLQWNTEVQHGWCLRLSLIHI